MKKITALLIVFMFFASFCIQSAVADGFFGKKPEKSIYASVGYLTGTAGTNKLVFNYEMGKAISKESGRRSESEETALAGLAVKLGWNVTTKIFAEMNYTPGETMIKIGSGYLCEFDRYAFDSNGNWLPIRMPVSAFDYREISVKSSPEISLNYVLLNLSKFRLYVGGGIRYVSINGQCDYINVLDEITSGSFAFASSGLNPSAKAGIKFPILGNVLGSLDYTYCCPITFCSDLKSVGHFATSLGDSYFQANIGIGF